MARPPAEGKTGGCLLAGWSGEVRSTFIGRVTAEIQRELDQADTFLTELSTGNAHARVARLMLYLAEREGVGESCHMPMREEIGALVGTTMETASRIVSDFRHRGLINPPTMRNA